ncbi:GGDEF domain-containing protein [Agarivorans sp. Toyoura001]|uniref:GGDEF domain-containing protein n=1 Tax=unclassified Agarivorans TaxID=2636026 RepID=UPI0010EA3CF1|nr:GGDEF domain-containing protein [Agarivorans sp. Toyoura001]GDY25931.1 GGDEF domain-containing protein [Agarivorans sp. Toyoura001]
MHLSTAQLLEIVSAFPDSTLVFTEDGYCIAHLGDQETHSFSCSRLLTGRFVADVFCEEKAKWFMQQIRMSIFEQNLRVSEYSISPMDMRLPCSESSKLQREEWFEARILPLQSFIDGHRAVVWAARNINERYKLEQQLRFLSETDALTGAFNRRRFFESLANHFQTYHRHYLDCSLIMIDIDHFKAINDEHGHPCGDRILKQLYEVIKSQLRDVDLCSRMGGEEFAILLPHTEVNDAFVSAERIRKAVEQQLFSYQQGCLHVTVSIGVSSIESSDISRDSVLQRADDALYQAKKSGRNRSCQHRQLVKV